MNQVLKTVFQAIALLQIEKESRADYIETLDEGTSTIKKEKVQIPVMKLAENKQDMQVVFDKEFRKVNATNKTIFRDNQIIQVKKIVEELQQIEDVEFLLVESATKYLHWLKSETEPEPEPEPKNWHPEIFKNADCFKVFIEYLKESNHNNFLREYSFIYRAMREDEQHFIHDHIEQSNFRKWFNSNFEELEKLVHPVKLKILDQSLKTYDDANRPERKKRYSRLIKTYLKT